ncbi:MAG: hypothetical protein FD124_1039 [Alphaproteobacteria bacterium]|nr:MAG: hypothetical protein FD160_1018 [Caulobacteraceae bacterium]TPW07592.1 MAG: hypothetical protein FD124_1039 [Alphaproteobacteria bacterium]
MRHFWLTVLLTVTLVAGGFANALAAQACSMQPQATAAHDCCPDDDTSRQAPVDPSSKDMEGCLMGQACRTAPAVTPTVAPILLSSVIIPVAQPMTGNPAPARAPLSEHWRPPRSV